MSKELPTKQQLLSVLEKIPGTSVLVVGDLMLDRYIWGKVERISPEAPVPVVEVKSIEDRLGGAGNVVRNLCNLGVKVTVCGYVGDDEEGATILKLLRDSNVDKDGVIIDRQHPTSLKTRVVAHPQQIVRIDREDKSPRSIPLQNAFASMIEAHFTNSGVQGIIVSDYAKGAISNLIMEKFSQNALSGVLGRAKVPLVIDPHPSNYNLYKNITIAKPNKKEAEAASGMSITDHESALKAAQIIMEKWSAEMMMITLGEGGMIIAERGKPSGVCLDTVAQEVFDVSGAGDTVTSVFTSALAVGADLAVAGQLANIAAGYVVSEVGTVAIDMNRLRKEVEALP
jgi:rfaE bifunctional protein kinase chain/domain